MYKVLYNSTPPNNLSKYFGALQPWQYYDNAWKIKQDTSLFEKDKINRRGRKPSDIAKSIQFHPYWEFDTDFGIWYLKKKPDADYPIMFYGRNVVGDDFGKMWWWRGSYLKESDLSKLKADDIPYEQAILRSFKTRYGIERQNINPILNRLYEISNEERNELIKSYDILEENIVLQVATLYMDLTEKNPEKYIDDWDKMTETERENYIKLDKFKAIPEKSIPQIDYFADIRGKVKDRADKKAGEYEFEPIKGRDTWNVLWRRGYATYKKYIDSDEGRKDLEAILDKKVRTGVIAEEKKIEAKKRTKLQIEKETADTGVEQKAISTEDKQTLDDIETRIDEIEDEQEKLIDKYSADGAEPYQNPEFVKLIEPLNKELSKLNDEKRLIGGWSTKRVEEGKNMREDIDDQKKYQAILLKEQAELKKDLGENVKAKNYKGGAEENTSGGPIGSEGVAYEDEFDMFNYGIPAEITREYIDGLIGPERSKIHDEIWMYLMSPSRQKGSNMTIPGLQPNKAYSWEIYDKIRKPLGLAKDSGIEASRIKSDTNREIKVASRMKRLEQTKQEVEKDVKWNQEAYDRVKKEIDDLEAKRADIKKRLPRAAQAQVDKLKKQQDDLDEKMKLLDAKLAALEKVKPSETKGGAIKKAKGRPMKMRFIAGAKDEEEEKPSEKPAEKKEETKKDIVGDVKKVVNIAMKGKQIYDKVDAFIDHLKPGSGEALTIVKEETRKDTKLTKAIEDLLDNYDEISKAEAEDKFNKIMAKIETEMRENAEKLARAGRIDAADLELLGYKDKLSKERESARERLKKRLEKTIGGEEPKKSTLDKIGVVVDVADKLSGQLDKLDPSKRYDVGETPVGTVKGPVKPSKRDRGSGKVGDFFKKAKDAIVANIKPILGLAAATATAVVVVNEVKEELNDREERQAQRDKEKLEADKRRSESNRQAEQNIERETGRKVIIPDTEAEELTLAKKTIEEYIKNYKEQYGNNPDYPARHAPIKAEVVTGVYKDNKAYLQDLQKWNKEKEALERKNKGGMKNLPVNNISKINIIDSMENEKQLKAGKKPNAWLVHVAAFRKENPGMKYSEVLKQAKATYTTGGMKGGARPRKAGSPPRHSELGDKDAVWDGPLNFFDDRDAVETHAATVPIPDVSDIEATLPATSISENMAKIFIRTLKSRLPAQIRSDMYLKDDHNNADWAGFANYHYQQLRLLRYLEDKYPGNANKIIDIHNLWSDRARKTGGYNESDYNY